MQGRRGARRMAGTLPAVRRCLVTVVEFLARHPVGALLSCAALIVTSGLVICLNAAAEADSAGVDL